MTATIQQEARRPAPLPLADDAMVVVDGLVKRYPKRDVNAVDGISFSVARGEIFGLLGPNGAGKSTTIGVMTTRVRPTGGRVLVAGVDVARDPVAAKQRFGVVPQRNNLDRALTARQNLLFHAAYFGFSKKRREAAADALLEEFGLADRANDKTDGFSGGMAQRLMIARALMHQPELLFLDEPSTGLDPQSRLFVHERVEELNRRGVTVLVTTHDMHEAEKLSRRIAIVDHGKVLALDTPDALRRLVPSASAVELVVAPRNGSAPDQQSLVAALSAVRNVERVETVAAAEPAFPGFLPGLPPGAAPPVAPGPPKLRVYSTRAPELVPAVLETVAAQGAEAVDLRITRPTLEDVFIHLTGRALR